ncbi:AraC family transcriptional regulator [Caballeronia hypogeia]|uniref:AraC family transcriptional regulator n=1 Tax=Caballeronia hypogeia TaxID=1777140 RepID=A0A158CJ87_9BURK|nr:AraC family transcriptional regulator [Caballeronia hypogeia]SAK82341.1 AraC family transcriptional regulator [Caballeronia hypogeia]
MGPLIRALDAAGADTESLLTRYRLNRRMLSDPYEILPVITYIEIFEEAAALLSEPTLGLRLGRDLHLSELGPAGLVFTSSSTLKVAMRKFSRAIESWQGSTSMDLLLKHDAPSWFYQISDASIWPRAQDTEFSLSAMCNMIRLVRGPNWNPVEVQFEHAPPSDLKPYSRMFRCPVRFSQQTNAVLLSSKDLDAQIKSADIHMAAMMERHAADLIAREAIPHSLVEQVRDLVARRLSREKLIVGDIAKDLGLSQRSLQRHLADAGTSVRDIVREVRKESVETLSAKDGMSRAALARAVGYADSSVLWRATQNWASDNEPAADPSGPAKKRE